MAARIFLWLTDEEVSEYERRCEKLGIPYTQLATLILCKWLALEEIPTKPKKRDKWLTAHVARTKAEFSRGGSGTARKAERIMRDSGDGAWTITELASAMGWKRPGGLGHVLRDDPRFETCDPPKDWTPQRGKRPQFWRLADLD